MAHQRAVFPDGFVVNEVWSILCADPIKPQGDGAVDRHRMCGLDDLDALARHRMAMPGDDQAGERTRPVRLDGLGHAEIAERLGVSVSRVRQYLAQGMRQCYVALYGEPT